MRSGYGRASAMLASMPAADRHSAALRPISEDIAPQSAEPSAKAPSEHSVCIDAARARTQDGALVWVAALKVDIIVIHAAPPSTKLAHTSGRQVESAPTSIAPENTRQQPAASASSEKRERMRPTKKPAATAPVPRQAISRP